MDSQAEEFLWRLREANAEELRNRVLERARDVIKKADLSEDKLSQIDIDVSEYLMS